MSETGVVAAVNRPMALWRARSVLGLLVRRDLKVRYADSLLGYFWSILDPLLMAAVYWFVFTKIFPRSVGEEPYIIFLLAALLPWTWFQNCVGDSAKSLQQDSRLVRSTRLPREVWPLRVVLSKTVEFGFSIPVLGAFLLIYHPHINSYIWLFPLAVVMQLVLLAGLGLLLAPLEVLLRDIDPLIRVAMRVLFYASPVLYGIQDVYNAGIPDVIRTLYLLNPMSGIITAYRAGFFAEAVHWDAIAIAGGLSVLTLVFGWIVFARTERSMLKEL
ncbi:ABC transporter permease [Cellulosimicrobium cellulans]|uniref:ABC transporter permease n=1 Tax=Cellulosimicrobium cellulans TaxID=1710 RepID=UPI002ADD3E8C|nr:ABC transporter permease [Cellulosimicrobium cellulans]